MLAASRLKAIMAASVLTLLFPLCGLACRWAQSNVSALSLRVQPAHSAEMETQVTLGAPLRIDSVSGDWARVLTADGVTCYAPLKSIVMKDSADMARWRRSPRVIVTALEPVRVVADTLGTGGADVVSDVTLCSVLEGSVAPGASYVSLRFPDGRRGFLPSWAVEDLTSWSCRSHTPDEIISVARSMTGVPYLWGGTTSKAVDCSGFTQTCFFYAGSLIPRNSRGQAAAGMPVDMDGGLHPCDLLFFGEGDGVKITHVGISTGGSRFIHSSGLVFESSFDPADPLFIPRKVLSAVRFQLDDPRFLVSRNTFYFPQDTAE